MSIEEQIEAEIKHLSESDLSELHKLVKDFVEAKSQDPSKPPKSSFMSKLRQIKIEAPEDFSKNLDKYSNGEQLVE